MSRALRILGLLVVVAMPTMALAASTDKQVWVTNCNKAQYKPKLIVIACGDGGTLLKDLQWNHWNTATATGTGTEWVNTCTPNCAAGHFRKTAATVTLSKPITCHKQQHKVFNRLGMQFRGASGPHSTEIRSLGCPF